MAYETYYNTPVFNDPKPCEAEGCEEGYVYEEEVNEDGELVPTKEKCPWCDEYGHKH